MNDINYTAFYDLEIPYYAVAEVTIADIILEQVSKINISKLRLCTWYHI